MPTREECIQFRGWYDGLAFRLEKCVSYRREWSFYQLSGIMELVAAYKRYSLVVRSDPLAVGCTILTMYDTWLSMDSLVNCTKDSHHGIQVRHDLSLICLLDILLLQLIPESHE